MFSRTNLSLLIVMISTGCSQAENLASMANRFSSRNAVLHGSAFGLPNGADDASTDGKPDGADDGKGSGKPGSGDGSSGGSGNPDGADDGNGSGLPGGDNGNGSGTPDGNGGSGPGGSGTPSGDDSGGGGSNTPPDGGSGTPPIVTKPPIFNICWTKADQNNKETVLSSPGVSYKIYNYSGEVVYHGNTSASAAAAAKHQLQTEKTITVRMPSTNGNYLLAFCDSSKHNSCSISTGVMGSLGGSQKSFGFRSLKDAPAVIGAIPNMKVVNNKLYSADQPFIIYNSVEDPFCMAAWSPLVIDMEGKGVVLSSQAQGVQFDMDGDGKKDQISWPTSPSSVFVTLDRNGNGSIDSVHELFGNNTVGPDGEKAENGFVALAKYDANGDKLIDAKDEIYKKLRIWSDKNRNGISEPQELTPLDKAGIAEIDLNYVDIFEIDAHGNQTLQRSTVAFKGKKPKKKQAEETLYKMIFDIWFKI